MGKAFKSDKRSRLVAEKQFKKRILKAPLNYG